MFLKGCDHAAASERVEQADHRLSHEGHAANALIASPGDDEDFVGPIHLLLSQPGFGADDGFIRRRQRLTQVQRSLTAEAGFVKGLPQPA